MFEFPEVLIIGDSVYRLDTFVQSDDITAEKFYEVIPNRNESTLARDRRDHFFVLHAVTTEPPPASYLFTNEMVEDFSLDSIMQYNSHEYMTTEAGAKYRRIL